MSTIILEDRGVIPVRFEILRHEPHGYAPVEAVDGWLASDVFGESFRLDAGRDPRGHPLIALVKK